MRKEVLGGGRSTPHRPSAYRRTMEGACVRSGRSAEQRGWIIDCKLHMQNTFNKKWTYTPYCFATVRTWWAAAMAPVIEACCLSLARPFPAKYALPPCETWIMIGALMSLGTDEQVNVGVKGTGHTEQLPAQRWLWTRRLRSIEQSQALRSMSRKN